MSIVKCDRCERTIDIDFDSDVYTNEDLPRLTENDYDCVCSTCITDEEIKQIEN